MSIHYPKPGKEEFLIVSMHRFGKAMEGKRGFVLAQTSRDEDKDILVGLAIWNSKSDWQDARESMINAVKDDPFEEWEIKPPEVYHLNKV